MILIIDDDIAVRASLLLLLHGEGYKAMAVSSEAEALNALKQHVISLVILDLNFSIETSGKEGMALLEKIRQMNSLVAGDTHYRMGQRSTGGAGMKLGANDFINKPWNNEHLFNR
jgi:DNA-binding NtrC family response regulator